MKTPLLLLGLSFLPALAAPLKASNAVTVHVASGRQFRGLVDPQTDDTSLILRIGKPHVFVRRPIAWERVTSVVVEGASHSAAEFRKRIASPDWQWADENSPEEVAAPQAANAPVRQVAVWEPEVPDELIVPAVVALHIDAYVANWDTDVEADGLVVHVYPLDDAGQTVPALGTLQVDLIGTGATNLVSGNPFPLLGQWSQLVSPQEVGPTGAVFRFPFTWTHPDFSDKWGVGSFGMVHARLAVGGQGVYEDTASFTRIRPFSPIRDGMQQYGGRRFSPLELTSYPYR
jgi:hypothetical protein